MQDHWAEHGFGAYALESREPDLAGQFLGFLGVTYPPLPAELAARPELGWRLARDAWGRGLATEGSRAARNHAFDTLGLPELISIVHPENTRSSRLASKLGMTLAQQVRNPLLDRDVDVWQLTSPHSQPTAARGGRGWRFLLRSEGARRRWQPGRLEQRDEGLLLCRGERLEESLLGPSPDRPKSIEERAACGGEGDSIATPVRRVLVRWARSRPAALASAGLNLRGSAST